jgi:hypothetical protein
MSDTDLAAYELWYDSLQLSDRSRWSERVRDYFTDGDGLSWGQWWEKCRYLFVDDETELLTMWELKDSSDFEHYWDTFKGENDVKLDNGYSDTVVLAVHLHATRTDLIAAFEKVLNERHTGTRGRPAKTGTLAAFHLRSYPNVEAVKKALEVWRYRHSHPQATLSDVGIACKVNRNMIPANYDPNDTTTHPDSHAKRVLAATVSRYLKHATQLIRGVEQGTFPTER